MAAHEPPGKPIRHCRVVPVKLTYLNDADVDVQCEHGTVELRALRLYRFATQARKQGGLLSYEDLSYLLCVDISTIKDLVRRLREQGLVVPTRGAIHDIGPEPSHKRIIAEMLGRGFSTSQIRAATRHSEHAIGRYQAQFGLVLYLLHHYPDTTADQRALLSGLSLKAYETYLEVYRLLADRVDCQPHLERLRRRYEMDPERVTGKRPPGKAPDHDPQRRLGQQTLATAVRQTIQEDLDTTRRVAQAVTDDVMALVTDGFQLADTPRPGEVVTFIDAHDPGFVSGNSTPDRKVIPVTLPLHTEQLQRIWRGDAPVGERRARIASLIATAAHEQGGVMSIANLAELLHVTPSTLAKDLRELAVKIHVEAPTKGLVEDLGPTLTHKDWIVDLDQHGLTGEEIAWLTRHAPASRDRYIETYRRAEILMRLDGAIPDADRLARVLRTTRHVAQQYVDLLRRYHSDGESTAVYAPTANHHDGTAEAAAQPGTR